MKTWLSRIFGRSSDSNAERRSIAGGDSWLPAPTLAGVVVTPETALGLTAVFACVNVIASSVASMPFLVYDRQSDGGRTPNPDDPVYDLLAFEPNPEMGANAFWTAYVANAVLGNAYAEITRDSDGSPNGLHLLDSLTTDPKRDSAGKLYYTTTAGPGPMMGQQIRLLPENVLHVANLSLNGISGMVPVKLAQTLIGAALAADMTGAAVFGNGITPLGVLEVPDELDDQGRKTLREYWQRIYGGPTNAGKVPILEQGIKFNPLSVDLNALQHNDFRRLAAKQIAQLFGVPPHKIGILDNATYGSLEEQDLDFYKSTLRIWCERIESEVNRKMFTREERRTAFAEHNMNAVVRGNLASLTDHLTKMVGVGAYSVNGVCRELNLNPIGPEGDRRFVSAQLVPLDAVKAPTDDPSKSPTFPAEGDDPPPKSAKSASAEAVATVRSVVLDALTRCIRKETSALRRAVKRPDFPAFATSFYAEHEGFLAEALAPSLRALSVVSGSTELPIEWAARIASASYSELTRSTDVEAVLKSWEDGKASKIMESLP